MQRFDVGGRSEVLPVGIGELSHDILALDSHEVREVRTAARE